VRAFLERTGGTPLRGIGLLGTVLLHGTVVLTVVVAARSPARASLLPAYRVELVAAPLGGGTETPSPAATPPAAAARPPAARPERASARPAPRAAAPRAAAGAAPAPARRESAAPARDAPAANAPAPNAPAGPGVPTGQAGSTGADAATIRTEGVEFPFPGYLRNLVAQVYRRWRPPTGNADLEAEVLFVVHRDGSISGLQFVRRSGSFDFDLEAQGAVEAAARGGAFGALPTGYGPDALPVSFFFSPRSLR
jgi:outer membrane biosynthesis protein TonB